MPPVGVSPEWREAVPWFFEAEVEVEVEAEED